MPRAEGSSSESCAASITGRFFDTTYISPLIGSTAELAQFAPPLCPGISIEPWKLGGVNKPSLRDVFKRCRSVSCSAGARNGLMSFSVNDCTANGGGFVGNGCVGEVCSPGRSDC